MQTTSPRYVSHPYAFDTPISVGDTVLRRNGQPTKITVEAMTTITSGERRDGVPGPYTFREPFWVVVYLSNNHVLLAPPVSCNLEEVAA